MPQTIDVTNFIVEVSTVKPIRLNLGAGINADGTPRSIPGYIDIDRHYGTEIYPLDCADNSVDEIRCSHTLEHFGQGEVLEVLKHWVSKIKPGGILKIAVPDLPRIFDAYVRNEQVPIMSFLYGGQTDANDFHKCGFDEALLRNLLCQCELEDIRRWESEIDDCAKQLGSFSLNLCGRKPSDPEIKSLNNVGGILVSARFGPTIHHTCTQRTMAQLPGMKCNILIGCFWWMQMCEGIQKHVEDGMEFVLTFDYDSVFSPSDVIEMYRIMKSDNRIDALCALQCKRGGKEVLFSLLDKKDLQVGVQEFGDRTMQIATGHFGLTMFRASSLKEFPKPWMTPIPGTDGTWNDGSGKVDPDINFWHRWRDAGKTLFLANRIPIGHVEEQVKWPSLTGDTIFQGIQDYSENGKPLGVWI